MRMRLHCLGLAVVELLIWVAAAGGAQLEILEVHRHGVDGVLGLGGANSVALSPDGNFIYVGDHAAPNYEGTIAVFSRNPADGRLAFVGIADDMVGGVDVLQGIIDVAVSPDGRNVYASGSGSGPGSLNDRIVVFDRDAETGELSVAEVETDGVGGGSPANPRGPYLSSDGLSVYAPTSNGDSLVVWSRDPGSGALTHLQTLRNGEAGVAGLAGGTGAGVTSDGFNVYGVGFLDNAISSFSRDTSSGLLSFLGAASNGTDGTTGLAGVYRLAISPDGANVYGASFFDSAVSVFRRDPGTGELEFLDAQFEGDSGVQGLFRANALAPSPDGRLLFVKGWGTVAVFGREPIEGRLSFLEALFDGVDGVDGIAAGSDLAVSPDGRNLYVAGHDDDALAVFRIAKENQPPTADAGPDQVLEADATCHTEAHLDGRGSSDADGDALEYNWSSPVGTFVGAVPSVSLGLGSFQFSLAVEDPAGASDSDEVEVRVADTAPPQVAAVSASPSILWPPNHQMISVGISATSSDACGGSVSCSIASVASNEPVTGSGTGSTSPDWVVVSSNTLLLRSERAGNGTGRVYTVGIRCADERGNATMSSLDVVVPHDRR